MVYLSKFTGWVRRQLQIITSEEAIAIDNNSQREALPEKLIVGLGNPGRKYAKNRHNIGFMVVDRLAQNHEIEVGRKKHKAFFGTGRIRDHQVVLAKPQTFMNLSGDSVGRITDFYDIEPEDVLAIYDEIDLPFGTLRIREKGGSGGHNGMKSVISRIGQDFARIRIGVDRPPGRMDPAAFVLRDFDADQWLIVDELINKAVLAIESILSEGVDRAMTRFNGQLDSDP
jgi:PTH1 family peptidyl-tRNA hydrolase